MYPQRVNDILAIDGDSWSNSLRFRSGMGVMGWVDQVSLNRPVSIINRAYGGRSMLTAYNIAPQELPLDYSAGAKSNIYVMFLGSNDTGTMASLLARSLALGTIAKNAGFTTIGVTQIPYDYSIISPGDFTIDSEAHRQDYNAAFKVQSCWDRIADFGSDPIMGNPSTPFDPTYYQTDREHPNATGNAILAGIIRPIINSVLGA